MKNENSHRHAHFHLVGSVAGKIIGDGPRVLEERQDTFVLSTASLWEMQIKLAIGKLELRLPLADLVREQRERNGFEILPITLPHILELETLPMHHKDPFDRLLIAQAKSENLPILSADAISDSYPIRGLS